MVQEVRTQPSIFGRLGQGLGQGLAESIPKEVERNRLSSGLKDLGEQKGLTPFQQFSRLASTPGITPQMIQSGSDLLRQQSYLDALKNQFQGQGGIKSGQKAYVPSKEELNQPTKGEIPTLADPQSTEESYKTFIPPSEQQERQDAYDNFQKNPARYDYKFDNALNERKAITSRNQEIQKAYQNQEATAVAKEETVKKAFDKEASRLGIVPRGTEQNPANFDPKLYQLFEESLLNSILPKKDGGEGLTQEQAIKQYSKQLEAAFRSYQDLNQLSPWSPREFDRVVNSTQKNLSHFGQPGKQVLMDKLIADQG